MVGSINNGFPQQLPVFKSLNTGAADEKQLESAKNPVQENKNANLNATNEIQESNTVNNTARSNPVQQFGQDNGSSTRSADRGQNLDISV